MDVWEPGKDGSEGKDANVGRGLARKWVKEWNSRKKRFSMFRT